MSTKVDTNRENKKEIETKREQASIEGLELLARGRKLFLDSNLPEAAGCLQKAAELLNIAEDYKNYCDAMNVLGVVLVALGNDSIAIDHYLDALEVANRYNIDVSSISILNNLGSRFHMLGAQERALEYLLTAMKLLESIPIDTDERLPFWKLIMEVNICNAYRKLGKFELAKSYMERVENNEGWKDEQSMLRLFYFSYRVVQANLKWDMGFKDEVRESIPELVELAMHDGNVSDYVQDIEEFIDLLQATEEKTYWEMMLQSLEQYASHQDSLRVKMLSVEKWIKFFKYYDMKEKYEEACILYTKLALDRSEADIKDRLASMELKVSIREREAATRKYQKMANVDALTGIGNRNKLEADSKTLLEKCIEDDKFIGIGLFDLDHFKEKNDTHGHIIGDACITCLIRALKKSLGSLNYAYRFGGDEFVVLLQGATRDSIKTLANKVKETLRDEQRKDKDLCKIEEITLSQGYAYGIPEKGDTFLDLLETADKALYKVKASGRNGYSIYDHLDIREYSIH